MNTQETIIQLKELKLKGMADTLESLMGLPVPVSYTHLTLPTNDSV